MNRCTVIRGPNLAIGVVLVAGAVAVPLAIMVW
jgi:hypothetical protein